MAIKVQFPVGESNVTAGGLYQWDYGQVLEIECTEIGSEILEVHFACPNMSEAIVRSCTFSNGVGTVTIPDECLEQTSSITAWLCRRDSAQRRTIKTIVLPLTTRTRPGNMLDDVPVSYTDAVGQLIEEVNEAVDALENGNVTVAKATTADTAGHATTAGSATSATYATSAGRAVSLNVDETFIGDLPDGGTEIDLEYGKVYIISARNNKSTDSVLDTYILYVASEVETSGTAIAGSESTWGRFNIFAQWIEGELRFFIVNDNGSITRTPMSDVTIRKI